MGESKLVDACTGRGLRTITFGDGGDVTAEALVLRGDGSDFTLRFDGREAGVRLSVPGRYNVANALAAAGGCIAVGLGMEEIAAGLSSFHGVERRFDVRGSAGGVTVVDDYAHNPSKVKAVLSAAKLGAEDGRWTQVVAVFQPHRYSRTCSFIKTSALRSPMPIGRGHRYIWSGGRARAGCDRKAGRRRRLCPAPGAAGCVLAPSHRVTRLSGVCDPAGRRLVDAGSRRYHDSGRGIPVPAGARWS